ncbi:MarR family winged helix-turn-helix transcriptional regulator [Xanthobacter pseudotagetidis]|uniref:MarR family winged helix-turn-helix transcriptional regulator n=1 Tax=Xanthobacter pseudotagetidis TaxID=3119911 RepID=UPI0037278429
MVDRTAPPIKVDYLQLQLGVLSELLNSMASPLHENAFGISVRELRILRFAYVEPGLNLGRLMAQTVIEKTVLSKLVTSLVRRGFMKREIDAVDARCVNLFLTRRGVDVVLRADAFSRSWEEGVLSILTPEEDVILKNCLAKLTAYAKEQISEANTQKKPTSIQTEART